MNHNMDTQRVNGWYFVKETKDSPWAAALLLFSTSMVQAILEGRKSQTRRIIKPQPPNDVYPMLHGIEPKYRIGDVLWIRETWQHTNNIGICLDDPNSGYIYKASENGKDWEENMEGWQWKPSIFMPKEACRIRLRVTNIGVEKLQDISEEDAINEGIKWTKFSSNAHSPIVLYKSLWESINGKDSWDLNPWVFVIHFEKI
jgi:hypothetical protein